MKNCRIINFKKIGYNDVGFLIALEGNRGIPFDIKRIYYIYNVPKETKRGFHAHKRLEQVLICMSGSVKIKVDDGSEKIYLNFLIKAKDYILDRVFGVRCMLLIKVQFC